MYHPMIRASALAWLTCFEFFLFPLRSLATTPGITEAQQRALQEEVWNEIAATAPRGSIDEPIFTDEVVARAKLA